MTRAEALEKAETRVWCFMTRGDIDYYFEQYNLTVVGANGRKKSRPNRTEKEQALIEYLTDKMTTEPDDAVEKQQEAFESRWKHDIEVITNSCASNANMHS